MQVHNSEPATGGPAQPLTQLHAGAPLRRLAKVIVVVQQAPAQARHSGRTFGEGMLQPSLRPALVKKSQLLVQQAPARSQEQEAAWHGLQPKAGLQERRRLCSTSQESQTKQRNLPERLACTHAMHTCSVGMQTLPAQRGEIGGRARLDELVQHGHRWRQLRTKHTCELGCGRTGRVACGGG